MPRRSILELNGFYIPFSEGTSDEEGYLHDFVTGHRKF